LKNFGQYEKMAQKKYRIIHRFAFRYIILLSPGFILNNYTVPALVFWPSCRHFPELSNQGTNIPDTLGGRLGVKLHWLRKRPSLILARQEKDPIGIIAEIGGFALGFPIICERRKNPVSGIFMVALERKRATNQGVGRSNRSRRANEFKQKANYVIGLFVFELPFGFPKITCSGNWVRRRPRAPPR
jgi:hypothetical protein